MSEIYYQCQRCTNCCRWPGTVALAEGEAEPIAEFLKLEVTDFINRYTDLLANRNSLTLISLPNHECLFLHGRDCAIESVKPKQCAGFPNAWNFPGWQRQCEAIGVVKT